eukprot:8275323-Heterocapsa_arctica.AAC.2
MAQNLSFVRGITGRGRLNVYEAIQEAMTRAQWHNNEGTRQDTDDPSHRTDYTRRHVAMLVVTTDLGT